MQRINTLSICALLLTATACNADLKADAIALKNKIKDKFAGYKDQTIYIKNGTGQSVWGGIYPYNNISGQVMKTTDQGIKQIDNELQTKSCRAIKFKYKDSDSFRLIFAKDTETEKT